MSITDRHTEELVRRLTEPFKPEAIKTRSGGGNTRLSYVEAHTVIRRLNAATGGRWDFQVLHEQQDGDLLKATCRLTIPGLGSREHVGVQKVSERGGEDLHKGAISDALKKCATLFGVGLDLYGEDYEADDRDEPPARRRPQPPPRQREERPAPPTHPRAATPAPQQANGREERPDDDGPRAVTWTDVWREAKARGIAGKEQLAAAIRVDNPAAMDPGDVLSLLRDTARPLGYAG